MNEWTVQIDPRQVRYETAQYLMEILEQHDLSLDDAKQLAAAYMVLMRMSGDENFARH